MSISKILHQSQDFLSVSQAIPIIGSIPFSPLKTLVSTVQTIYGLAKGLFCAIASCFARDGNDYRKQSLQGFRDAKYGLIHFGYSIINFYTLGLFGLIAEQKHWVNPFIGQTKHVLTPSMSQ